jgi:hypothetical protein
MSDRTKAGTSPKDTPQRPEETGSYLLTLPFKPDITRIDLKFSPPRRPRISPQASTKAINSLWKGYTLWRQIRVR